MESRQSADHSSHCGTDGKTVAAALRSFLSESAALRGGAAVAFRRGQAKRVLSPGLESVTLCRRWRERSAPALHATVFLANSMEPRLILIQLLVKLGVAAAVSSALVRSVEFKSLLFREERTLRQKIYLVLWFGLPITIGVWIRFSAKSFLAGDLSFETALLLGAIGGRWAGVLGGILMALPALVHGEWATLPFGVLCGLIAGQLRTLALDKEEIWSFSPFIDLSVYRWIRRNLPRPRLFD